MDPTTLTVHELRSALTAGELTARQATQAYLDRMNALNPRLHAYTEVLADRALERAALVDAGKITGPLAGVPIAIKDNLCTAYGKTTCSSRMLADYRSPFTATAVQRLEQAGAIVLGKTNLDEFAMGSSTENSAFGATRNPWDEARVPGGSSGGSAAALAARLCAASLGSDTGGSIRQPAAFCGVWGLKPTYGRISRWGLIAFASSLDQIGPFTHDATDLAILLGVMSGHDPLDSTCSTQPVPNYLAEMAQPRRGLRVGLAKQYLSDANDPALTLAMDRAVAALKDAGVSFVDVDLPHTSYGIPTYYIVATAEASSNLARYDGVHYGHRCQNVQDLLDLYSRSRAEGFGPEVQRRIMLGTYALSSGYYDAYYLRALKVRRLIKNDFDAAFKQCDAILCPTTTGPAFRLGAKSSDPLQMYLNDVYTVTCNLAGIPGLSLPAGLTTVEGVKLPLGLQLLGPEFSESTLLALGRLLEQTQAFPAARAAIA